MLSTQARSASLTWKNEAGSGGRLSCFFSTAARMVSATRGLPFSRMLSPLSGRKESR
jgi:hypothetical protein